MYGKAWSCNYCSKLGTIVTYLRNCDWVGKIVSQNWICGTYLIQIGGYVVWKLSTPNWMVVDFEYRNQREIQSTEYFLQNYRRNKTKWKIDVVLSLKLLSQYDLICSKIQPAFFVVLYNRDGFFSHRD